MGIANASVAQVVEQQVRNSKPGILNSSFMFKLEPLCQLLKPRFEANIPFSVKQFFSV